MFRSTSDHHQGANLYLAKIYSVNYLCEILFHVLAMLPHTHTRARARGCMYVYVCMRVCVYVCVCMYVCVYVCMYACVCVCMYVCM
jgi:hypothetical protein